VMVSKIYKTNLSTVFYKNCDQCIDPPFLVKCSGQGGGFVSCSPKYIIKKMSLCMHENGGPFGEFWGVGGWGAHHG
jgi:hypothetical protein